MTESIAIVTTSINKRPASYVRWASQGKLIVAGDVNTPVDLHEYVTALNGRFLIPEHPFPGMNYVTMRCIQRRNAAIWFAFVHGFDYVLTVDDDNTPVSDSFARDLCDEIGHSSRTTIGSRSGFLNLGDICVPSFHQRGTPYGVSTPMDPYSYASYETPPTVVVAQAMVLGDPDCDAIDRMINRPDVRAVQNRIVVTPGTYAAFNSQATAWRRDWAPVMAVLPHVGRYDDIFAAFIFHRLAKTYNVALYAGDPVVKQDRNEHNLVKDLAAELYGMRVVFDFCSSLTHAIISPDMPLWQAYSELIEAVSHLLPEPTIRFTQEWVRAWRDVTL